MPDDLPALVRFLRDFQARCAGPAFLMVTGGLGPTLDDKTRDAAAEAFDAPLAENAACREAIETLFHQRGWPLAESNYRQAFIPQGATPLPNSCGTAPGFYVSQGGTHMFAMPGVPAEMFAMFTDHVQPILAGLLPQRGVVAERMIHTCGMGESSLGQVIADLMVDGRNPQVGTLASSGLVRVRLRASAATEAEAAELLGRDEATIRQLLGDVFIGPEGMAENILSMLKSLDATLAMAESCTGGLIGKMLTDVPGASDVLIEDVVTYANRSKIARLGVAEELIAAHGAVSEPVVRAMAEGVRTTSGATYTLATTGIAGPGGGTDEKPVGTVWIAVCGPEGTEAARWSLPGDRDSVRRRTALMALNLLRLQLVKAMSRPAW
jgi:nicotinamide-nucleotide amidase